MRLYLAIDRRIAGALRDDLPLNWTESLLLDEFDDEVVCVPGLKFYNFSLLDVLDRESSSRILEGYVELVIDAPNERVKRYEIPDPEGGNSYWSLPLPLVRQLIASAARNQGA